MPKVDIVVEKETFNDDIFVERDEQGHAFWLGNVQDVHGYWCSGYIKHSSNPYNNTLMIEDSFGEIHVLFKKALGLTLGFPTKTRDRNGKHRRPEGFVQPDFPVKKRADQPIKRRHQGITT